MRCLQDTVPAQNLVGGDAAAQLQAGTTAVGAVGAALLALALRREPVGEPLPVVAAHLPCIRPGKGRQILSADL